MSQKKKKNENFIHNGKDIPEVQELLKEYNNLDQSDDFVGSQFKTPKGGILTVTNVSHKDNNGIRLFNCICNICSKDRELFPENAITTYKGNLIKGQTPCACSSSYKWSKSQNILRVKREYVKRGYIFHGWYGNYNGVNTKLDLENPITGNRWCSTDIKHFLRGSGDPIVGHMTTNDSKTIPDEVYIEQFIATGVFPEGTKFYRCKDKSYYEYTCPVCSYDEYVQAGVCTGVFTSYVSSLRKGIKSCRCNGNYKWSPFQQEYKIKKLCTEEGLTYNGWVGVYTDNYSRFSWTCFNGHKRESTANGFINGGTRCRECYKLECRERGYTNGYFPERKDEIDFLYVINFNNQYIKVGRSFDISERMKGNKGLLSCSGMSLDQLTILKFFTATHQEVYDTEQWIHKELSNRGFYHEESDWTIETFDIDSEQLIYKLLEESDLVVTDIPCITKD